jgi:hypothetical protein
VNQQHPSVVPRRFIRQACRSTDLFFLLYSTGVAGLAVFGASLPFQPDVPNTTSRSFSPGEVLGIIGVLIMMVVGIGFLVCRRLCQFYNLEISGAGLTAVTAGKTKARLWHVPWQYVQHIQIYYNKWTTGMYIYPAMPTARAPHPRSLKNGEAILVEIFHVIPQIRPISRLAGRQLEEVVAVYSRLMNFQYSVDSGRPRPGAAHSTHPESAEQARILVEERVLPSGAVRREERPAPRRPL